MIIKVLKRLERTRHESSENFNKRQKKKKVGVKECNKQMEKYARGNQ